MQISCVRDGSKHRRKDPKVLPCTAEMWEDLTVLPGIGPKRSDALRAAKLTTVGKLAKLSAVAASIVAKAHKLPLKSLLSWVETAKELCRRTKTPLRLWRGARHCLKSMRQRKQSYPISLIGLHGCLGTVMGFDSMTLGRLSWKVVDVTFIPRGAQVLLLGEKILDDVTPCGRRQTLGALGMTASNNSITVVRKVGEWDAGWSYTYERWFFQNRIECRSSWERPANCMIDLPLAPPMNAQYVCRLLRARQTGLPSGWAAAWDNSRGRHYYFNRNTGERCWSREYFMQVPVS
eukprot:TRINITY_DN48901_c0_g1_i1.p1 TRINITY_DN48901_c0_g1~~TRINITY_DN48901_c0_g1_i1.p1  ORF type:complete len:291 (+),score=27.75 TRINITY_DN48901_c0_g1_i1:34-906(+)